MEGEAAGGAGMVRANDKRLKKGAPDPAKSEAPEYVALGAVFLIVAWLTCYVLARLIVAGVI